jgi:outer membrane immunogenic protein
MRSLLLAGTALALTGQAFAADMPLKAPPRPVAAAFSWTGCYVGGHVGAGWARADISDPSGVNIAPIGSSVRVDSGPGFLGGGQVGCDYQFASNWLIGAAGDFSWTNIDGRADDLFFAGKNPGPIVAQAKVEWLATATGRLGYVWDRLMVYGKGGAAWAHTRFGFENLKGWSNTSTTTFLCGVLGNAPCTPSGSDTRMGWTAGVGLAWAFAPSFSASVEFDHYDFSSRTVTLTSTSPNPNGPVAVRQWVEAVKVSLDYHFSGAR